jgi:hypothetical protein
MNMKPTVILFWLARIVAAIIMLQTLYFKFTASPESVFIFTTVGIEPWGRWLVGALELVASILLFIPATVWLGAVLAIGLMAGAMGMHVTLLGIEVQGDGGQLFTLRGNCVGECLLCFLDQPKNYSSIHTKMAALISSITAILFLILFAQMVPMRGKILNLLAGSWVLFRCDRLSFQDRLINPQHLSCC